jgi:hypothetical protein
MMANWPTDLHLGRKAGRRGIRETAGWPADIR